MKLIEATLHCKNAWSQYAERNNIHRDDEFYFLKMQEELGELTRSFLEIRGSEAKSKSSKAELQRKLEGDVTSLVGNALILADYFQVNLEKTLKEKFPVN